MVRRSKTSGTIILNFSETIQVQSGDLEIDLDISARIFIQKPQFYADNPDDCQGYWELECSSCQVKEARSFDEVVQDFIVINWSEFIKNYNRKFQYDVASEIESKVSKAIDRQLLKVI